MPQKYTLADKQQARFQRLCTLCNHIFVQNKKGKELMELLIDEYIVNRPVARESYKVTYGEHYVGIREGQNELIRELNNFAVNSFEDFTITGEKDGA
jgi:hypothetical protein